MTRAADRTPDACLFFLYQYRKTHPAAAAAKLAVGPAIISGLSLGKGIIFGMFGVLHFVRYIPIFLSGVYI